MTKPICTHFLSSHLISSHLAAPLAMSPMGMAEVLEAKMACAGSTASISFSTRCFTARS